MFLKRYYLLIPCTSARQPQFLDQRGGSAMHLKQGHARAIIHEL